MNALTCAQLRQIDRDAVRLIGLPSLLLMENAARGTCEAILRNDIWDSITIIAGPGNNGGDGLAIARQLAAFGKPSTVLLQQGGKQLSVDAGENLKYLLNGGHPILEPDLETTRQHLKNLGPKDLIVDALLGTGIRGVVQSPFRDVIECINASAATVFAVDAPSGLDCDTGLPCGACVVANRTITFVAAKKGFLAITAREFTGEVEICHIGIPRQWTEAWLDEQQGTPDL